MTKNIVILGSTGSIGRQALQVVDELAGEFRVVALAAGSNMELLAEQMMKHSPAYVSVASEQSAQALKLLMPDNKTPVFTGPTGLMNLAGLDGIDLILVAVTGITGLLPTIKALEKGVVVALANKETLVTAGCLVMGLAKEKKCRIIPVDSEHSAIFQCLQGQNHNEVEKLLLTASGGPFLHYDRSALEQVTPAMALCHPNWRMGSKITIDSAGLINKGLEVIEAHWLFDIPYEKIEVVIHPQSIIHSMVEFRDGAILAQCGLPDMRVPIQYALTYPQRQKNSFPKLDFKEIGNLSFQAPDRQNFPGLELAYEAGRVGHTMPTVYNAANEQAVDLFLQERIRFTQIPILIEKVMSRHRPLNEFGVEDILAVHEWALACTRELCAIQGKEV